MSLCKLCLFKSEPLDEILIEESDQLRQILGDLFQNAVILTKFELDGICPPCREKLKSFHEYYKFVLDNQKILEKTVVSETSLEFIEVIKTEELVKIEDKEWSDTDSVEPPLQKKPQRRIQRPRRYMMALQKQQSDLIATLFEFTCPQCHHDFPTFRDIVNHYKREHKKTKSWQCCGKEMSAAVDLIEHILLDHQSSEWKCHSCTKTFPSAIDVWTHGNKNHRETSKIPYENPVDWLKLQFICNFCGQRFRTRGFISRHLKDVHIKNYTCYICKAEFYNKRVYAKHRQVEHSTVLKVKCHICGVVLKNEARHLSAHIKNLHNKVPLICPTCGKVCKNDHAMKVHTIMEHKPPKHACRFCPKKFKTANHLKDHEAVHLGISRYFCEICRAPFKSIGNYSAHKRRLHPAEYQQQKLERKAKKYQM